eukprot:Amastigsp_a346468_26.p2 type:complete len:158 gc:universal Amastigsp_a346468_26:507-34(-)
MQIARARIDEPVLKVEPLFVDREQPRLERKPLEEPNLFLEIHVHPTVRKVEPALAERSQQPRVERERDPPSVTQAVVRRVVHVHSERVHVMEEANEPMRGSADEMRKPTLATEPNRRIAPDQTQNERHVEEERKRSVVESEDKEHGRPEHEKRQGPR